MIRSHHITAQLAREHQCDLLLAARDANGGTGAHDAVEPAAAHADGSRLILRPWRARRERWRAAAVAERGELAGSRGRCA